MQQDLSALLDASQIEGLALDKQPTGYTASIFFEAGHWSSREFGATASSAIAKVLRLHAPTAPNSVAPNSVAPNSVAPNSVAPVSIAPIPAAPTPVASAPVSTAPVIPPPPPVPALPPLPY